MTAGYRLTGPANADVEQIYNWTADKWGEAQADKYHIGLRDTFKRIVGFPALGIARPEFGREIRLAIYQSHKIFYRTKDSAIEVLAIVHIHRQVTEDIIFRDDLS